MTFFHHEGLENVLWFRGYRVGNDPAAPTSRRVIRLRDGACIGSAPLHQVERLIDAHEAKPRRIA